ncbi:MAG: hypothetical protein KC964_28055 [Candidatus Omnitrophica bacterium]|nr:hypothetical protein [Candidatus Omnitrophota bacterium]
MIGSIPIQYYALEPDHLLFYFERLPPDERHGKKLRTGENWLLTGDHLGFPSIHPSGGVEILIYRHAEDTLYLEHLDKNGKQLSLISLKKLDQEGILSGGYPVLFAATSFHRNWIALIDPPKRRDGKSGVNLRIERLTENQISHPEDSLTIPIYSDLLSYSEIPVAWHPERSCIYFTNPKGEVVLLDMETRTQEEIADGIFCGLVPQTHKILVQDGEKNFSILDTITRAQEKVQMPIKLDNQFLYSILPLPGGERIFYVTARFHLLMEDATNLWSANVDGRELKKIGKSRNSSFRDFRFVE